MCCSSGGSIAGAPISRRALRTPLRVNVFVVRFEAPFLRRLILRLSKVMRLFSAFMKGMHKKMEESRHHTPHETSRDSRQTKTRPHFENAVPVNSKTVPAAI
ncbi:uncharacterized protein LOC142564553 isoform X8 [Dermacentor variabilis]|uniref:uncharacterized protein LOC142564553 isoform X8 n=1 Tax=Dermacentor variabilis TaxID=34621 RepID=UPI003F5BCF01